jgi:hypothetical protein
LGCLLLAPACSTFATRVPDVQIIPARLAAMPTDVEVYELDTPGVRGQLTFMPTWTETAKSNVDQAVERIVASRGGRPFDRRLINETDATSGLFSQWSRNALFDIEDKMAGRSESKRRSVGEWRFPQSLEKWRTAVNSDFLLLTLFRDEYQSLADALLNLSVPRVFFAKLAKQMGIACIMDLRDGRMVQCERRVFGDLRTPEGAAEDVGRLLKGFWGQEEADNRPQLY